MQKFEADSRFDMAFCTENNPKGSYQTTHTRKNWIKNLFFKPFLYKDQILSKNGQKLASGPLSSHFAVLINVTKSKFWR